MVVSRADMCDTLDAQLRLHYNNIICIFCVLFVYQFIFYYLFIIYVVVRLDVQEASRLCILKTQMTPK